MRPKSKKKPTAASATRLAIMDVLLEIEPELRQLDGLLSVLTLLGEAADSVEPVALSSLGLAARESFDTINTAWRTLLAENHQ